MIILTLLAKKVYSGLKMNNQTILSKEKIMNLEAGEVKHVIKNVSNGFESFGEAYFSKIKLKYIKGWKKHKKMILNLVVPYGRVIFIVCVKDKNQENKFITYDLSDENNHRLTIPPDTWFAFKGLSDPFSLILNIASIVHDPDEVESMDINQIYFDWENIK